MTIDRAAHRSGSPLEDGSEEGIEGRLAPQGGREVGSQEVIRRRQVGGDRDVARGETEPGADERRKRDPKVPHRRSGPPTLNLPPQQFREWRPPPQWSREGSPPPQRALKRNLLPQQVTVLRD